MADPATGNVPITVDFEQSWGVAKVIPAGRKLSVIECNIAPNRGFQDNPSLRAGWNPAQPFPGAAKPGGTIRLVPNVHSASFFQKLLTGNLVKTGAADPWLATSELSTDMPKSAIVESPITVAGVTKYWRATGVRVQNWTIPIAHEGALIVDIGVGAKTVALETSAYDASPDDWSAATQIDQTKLQSGFVKIGGVAVGYLRGGSLTGDTRLQDDFRAGVDGRGSLVPMVHTLGGSLDIALDSAAALAYVTDGGVVDVELKWLVETDRYWRVKYHVILEPSGPPVKDGLINVTVNVRGFEDTGTGTAVEFETSVGTDPDTEYA